MNRDVDNTINAIKGNAWVKQAVIVIKNHHPDSRIYTDDIIYEKK